MITGVLVSIHGEFENRIQIMKDQIKSKDVKLSVIVVNYKTDDSILDLLRGISPNPSIETVIVDNSPENTLEKKLPKRHDLLYFFPDANLGFSRGNNFGISKSHGDWFFLLNSDTVTNTKDILRLLNETNKNKFLVSCPRLIQPGGVVQNNIGYFDRFFRNPINYIFARPRLINCTKISTNTTADLLTGAAMLIHKSVFEKVGLLDDKKFFMYFEDIDFSYRLYKAGMKILYCPSVSITHLGGASSDQDIRQKNKNYQHGLQTYLKKHRGALINWINNIFHFLS